MTMRTVEIGKTYNSHLLQSYVWIHDVHSIHLPHKSSDRCSRRGRVNDTPLGGYVYMYEN